jgi:hypothetical protein
VRRWTVIGALAGLIIALAFALSMPTKYVSRTYLPAPHGQRVPVYGALAPYAPRGLSVVTVQKSPRTVRDGLLGLIAGALLSGALATVGRPRPRHGG